MDIKDQKDTFDGFVKLSSIAAAIIIFILIIIVIVNKFVIYFTNMIRFKNNTF